MSQISSALFGKFGFRWVAAGFSLRYTGTCKSKAAQAEACGYNYKCPRILLANMIYIIHLGPDVR
jgi:hypothetical protein